MTDYFHSMSNFFSLKRIIHSLWFSLFQHVITYIQIKVKNSNVISQLTRDQSRRTAWPAPNHAKSFSSGLKFCDSESRTQCNSNLFAVGLGIYGDSNSESEEEQNEEEQPDDEDSEEELKVNDQS